MSQTWLAGDREFSCGDRPLWMGIVNVTPDSFSDGGRWTSVDAAVRHALDLVEQGADLLDVGGESTRPGAEPVSLSEELARVVPVIKRLSRETDVPISVDTYKAETARQALAVGASIVNDISGLLFDAEMPSVCAAARAGVVCMHRQGDSQTMQSNPTYGDVVAEIADFFRERLDALASAGIDPRCVVFDPGVGFGKTAEHNVSLLSNVAALRAVGRPVLIGHSRKRFLKRMLGRELDERLPGTIGVSVAVACQGADILRVHDVAANRDAVAAALVLLGR